MSRRGGRTKGNDAIDLVVSRIRPAAAVSVVAEDVEVSFRPLHHIPQTPEPSFPEPLGKPPLDDPHHIAVALSGQPDPDERLASQSGDEEIVAQVGERASCGE